MSLVRCRVRDAVAEILLDRPPVNAITNELLDELMAALRAAGDDAQVRAIVVGSALPGRFCAGLDLPRFAAAPAFEAHALVNRLYVELFELQARLPKPVIAAIAGSVRGGGMSIAITCDLIVADDGADFGYPELDVGLLPAIHFNHLPKIVGRNRAFDLLFTGRVFDADEALALGLVNRVVRQPDLLTEAHRLAQELAAKSPQLMRLGKGAFRRCTDDGYPRGAAGAADLLSTVFASADGQEGLRAFAEKRAPVWRGK